MRVNRLQNRNLAQRIKREIQALHPVLLKIYVPVCAVIVLIWAAIKISGISTYYFVADPAEITDQMPFIGAVSVLGNLIWCAIAAVCFFTVSLLKGRQRSSKTLKRFILFSGLFSAFFLLDDTFQIHEHIYDVFFSSFTTLPERERLHRDIVEIAVFSLYGSSFIAYLLYFKPIIKTTEILFLLLSFLFFGLSTVVDMSHKRDFLEESLKLLGIVSWFVYFFRFCKQTIAQHFSAKNQERVDATLYENV